MRKNLLIVIALFIFGFAAYAQDEIITINSDKVDYFLSKADSLSFFEYQKYFDEGILRVEKYFNAKFEKRFVIQIHADRNSLDNEWQKAWGAPDFKSECWMVASGTARRLDIIAPNKWDSLACEHKYKDTIALKNLIAHELVHVFHGQKNISHDFSNVENLDWFVEGLACFVSGQMDSARIAQLKTEYENGKLPDKLEKLWKGNSKYACAGSMVMFIEKKFGRKKIYELLEFNSAENILQRLKITEAELIKEWIDEVGRY